MTYPKIIVDLNTIRKNVSTIKDLCSEKDIRLAGVTKVFAGNPRIAQAYIDGGVEYLADSRIENLIRLKDLPLEKIMLRLPMISEAEEVVKYADISLNSEINTIRSLGKGALKEGRIHRIILMVDLGDLREGYYDERLLYQAVGQVLKVEGIELIGLGTNLTCYGGIIPSLEILDRLKSLARTIKEEFELDLEIISGGNSSSIHLLDEEDLAGINNLRLGESLILGKETAYGRQIDGTSSDGFKLEAEIIEIKDKASLPEGQIGRDAFGKIPSFVDRGIRKRIICAIGKQDVDFDGLSPLDPGLLILGGSSDHLIIDGSDSQTDYQIGDVIAFNMDYVSILRAMTSDYVKKEIIDKKE